jgi:glutamyl-Q tRNA(Asp) synthetase
MAVARFAPSPTGLLHLGHAYAALMAFDAAAQSGGRFLLRIEDIDSGRSRAEFVQAIFDDLAWLGLTWEEPVRRQSDHFDDYRAAIAKLEDQGFAYPCFCTRKEIEAEISRAGAAPHDSDLVAAYPGTCKRLSAGELAERIASGASHALRLDCARAVAAVAALHPGFDEQGHGPNGETGWQMARPELLGDIVLARKDLPASYHVAVVVDDALEGVTLVTRGQDLFAATHVQRLLQALLDLPTPAYAHHRLILDQSGRKFSKRNHAVTLQNLRGDGATPGDIRKLVRL